MYEYLLKWGLDTLVKSGLEKGKAEHSLLLEAVKTKNQLVVERFKIASSACELLVKLTLDVEAELEQFRQQYQQQGNQQYGNFKAALRETLHPKFYREYRKIRSQFDISNDLLSAYSMAFSSWLNFNAIEQLLSETQAQKPTEQARTYRMIWTFAASTLSRLLRISANDLRFWLTDLPYTDKAYALATTEDIPKIREFFIKGHENNGLFHPYLETAEGLEAFWRSDNT